MSKIYSKEQIWKMTSDEMLGVFLNHQIEVHYDDGRIISGKVMGIYSATNDNSLPTNLILENHQLSIPIIDESLVFIQVM